jgi:hypothetical protein
MRKIEAFPWVAANIRMFLTIRVGTNYVAVVIKNDNTGAYKIYLRIRIKEAQLDIQTVRVRNIICIHSCNVFAPT